MSNQPFEGQPPPHKGWYFTPDNRSRVGPFTLACLGQLLAAGHLHPDKDRVWQVGEQGWRLAGEVLGKPADHRPPRGGLTLEEIPWNGTIALDGEEIVIDSSDDDEFIDDDPPDEEHKAFLAEEAEKSRRAFALFSAGHSLRDLAAVVRGDPVVREWLQDSPSAYADLISGVYFPDLPLPRGRPKAKVRVRLRRTTDQSVVWPTDANFVESSVQCVLGIRCLYRYVLKTDLKARRWLKKNARHLFALIRLAVAHKPEECSAGSMCDGLFGYPVGPYMEKGGQVVVEGWPLNQCPGDEEHCVACCKMEELCPRCDVCEQLEDECNCGECRRCGEKTRDEDICEKCECCPKHCKHRHWEDDEDEEDEGEEDYDE